MWKILEAMYPTVREGSYKCGKGESKPYGDTGIRGRDVFNKE